MRDYARSQQTLRRVRDVLDSAWMSYEDLRDSKRAQKRNAGFHGAITMGRSVTNVLQNLRSSEPDFEAWYAPKAVEMRADPLLKYLYELRNTLLKEGNAQTYSSATVESFSMSQLPPRPPNAIGFFIGDRSGRSGWEVRNPDGSVGHIYVEMPEPNVRTQLLLSDAPSTHRGTAVADKSAENIVRLYLTYLRELVEEAERRFGSPRVPSST